MSGQQRRKQHLIQCRDGACDKRAFNSSASRRSSRLSEPQRRRRPRPGPDNIIRGQGQFLFTEQGERLLDCAGSVSHVGHCHPDVVSAYSSAQTCPLRWAGRDASTTNVEQRQKFLSALRATLPAGLHRVLLSHSGSSANSLAIQIARAATGNTDIAVFDHTFHGSLSDTAAISPITFGKAGPLVDRPRASVGAVHVLPVPDLYRGPYTEADPAAVLKYVAAARAQLAGVRLSCLVMEPILTFHGMTVPEPLFVQELVALVRQLGGLVIVDEVQSGLGRMGTVWGHQHLGIRPDVLTCGKPLSSGYPLGLTATSDRLMDSLGPLAAAVEAESINPGPSLAVLRVLKREGLVEQAARVGAQLASLLAQLQTRRQHLGQVTGRGLMVGLDMVEDQASRAPCPALAAWALPRMRERGVLIAVEGQHGNVLYLLPPLCFTSEDAEQVVAALDAVLEEAEQTGHFTPERLSTEDEEEVLLYQAMD